MATNLTFTTSGLGAWTIASGTADFYAVRERRSGAEVKRFSYHNTRGLRGRLISVSSEPGVCGGAGAEGITSFASEALARAWMALAESYRESGATGSLGYAQPRYTGGAVTLGDCELVRFEFAGAYPQPTYEPTRGKWLVSWTGEWLRYE